MMCIIEALDTKSIQISRANCFVFEMIFRVRFSLDMPSLCPHHKRTREVSFAGWQSPPAAMTSPKQAFDAAEQDSLHIPAPVLVCLPAIHH